jgi:hypothetical protein
MLRLFSISSIIKISALFIFTALFSCDSELSNYSDLEVIVYNSDFATINLYRDSTFTASQDFDSSYGSVHFGQLKAGNYRVEAIAEKRKKSQSFSYQTGQKTIQFRF